MARTPIEVCTRAPPAGIACAHRMLPVQQGPKARHTPMHGPATRCAGPRRRARLRSEPAAAGAEAADHKQRATAEEEAAARRRLARAEARGAAPLAAYVREPGPMTEGRSDMRHSPLPRREMAPAAVLAAVTHHPPRHAACTASQSRWCLSSASPSQTWERRRFAQESCAPAKPAARCARATGANGQAAARRATRAIAAREGAVSRRCVWSGTPHLHTPPPRPHLDRRSARKGAPADRRGLCEIRHGAPRSE